jgi:hypothetical protein
MKTIRAIEPADREPIVVDENLTIRPYTMRVPNRTALGTSFFTQKAECYFVSLPLLAIQEKAI